jgi:acetyl-CoA acetyltransferase family protein
MRERIAIIDGIRTPFSKAGSNLKEINADDLGAYICRELLYRSPIDISQIDDVVIGNVAQPGGAANIARIVALKAGIPKHVIASTVHRNCASGMESVTSGAEKILSGVSNIVLAGGTESMSQIPLLFNKKMTGFFEKLMRSKSLSQKIKTILTFRPSYLSPIIGVVEGLTDPVCGLNMGGTAEVLSREFSISREAQDEYALNSHLKASAAIEKGILNEEIHPIPIPPYSKTLDHDDGPRKDQTIEALNKLKPYFDRDTGSVTVGNACPLTDGAAAVLITSESKAKEMNLPVLGYLKAYAYAGLEGNRMGLGPVYATAKLLQKNNMMMSDFDLVEMNEAFAAQIIANEVAFDSDQFAQKYLNRSTKVGTIERDTLNVNGGAIAIGHPVGTTGTRLIITLLKELRRRNKNCGLATLCIGGGQGAALALEVE